MQTHTLWSCKPHMIICCTLPVSEAPSLPPRYFFPPSLHLSNFPTHLFSPSAFSWFLSSPPKLSFLFLLTHSASHSLLHLVLFLCYGGDLIYNQSSAVLKLSGTQVGCNWSAQLLIDQSQRDSTLSHSFTLALFLSLFSSSMLSLHLFPSLTVIKMQVVNMLIQ